LVYSLKQFAYPKNVLQDGESEGFTTDLPDSDLQIPLVASQECAVRACEIVSQDAPDGLLTLAISKPAPPAFAAKGLDLLRDLRLVLTECSPVF
jgi:hypothetical protein